MAQIVNYGLGGYCIDCNPSHDHPLNNIISIEIIPDEVTE